MPSCVMDIDGDHLATIDKYANRMRAEVKADVTIVLTVDRKLRYRLS